MKLLITRRVEGAIDLTSYYGNCHLIERPWKSQSMKIERLHIFDEKDWKQISLQFTELYAATFNFVTENKGSVAEAREVYVEAFLYYTQLLELHGRSQFEEGEGIVYSFARSIWIKKLRKRNVNINYVTHRREFFEMADAFHEIDSITERSKKTADKLAEIGEPGRTLVLEHIGKGQNIIEVAPRLGFSNAEKAEGQLVKCLRRVIKDTEGKELNNTDAEFLNTLAYILSDKTQSDNPDENGKVNLAMISRTVAMIKNYVERNNRLALFKDMETHFDPVVIPMMENQPEVVKTKKMRPVAIFLAAAVVALVVSALTAFGLAEIRDTKMHINHVDMIETTSVEEEVTPVEEIEIQSYTAFAISNDGYMLTTADAVGGKSRIRLEGNGSNRNLYGDVVALDSLNNFALVKCNFEKGTRISHRFSPENPVMGQSLFSLGFPMNDLFYSKTEINASLQGMEGKVRLNGFAPGSPVVSDKGQIVGMITSLDENDGLSNVTYISTLNDFLNALPAELSSSVKTPQRNALFYKNRVEQISAITPYIWRVK